MLKKIKPKAGCAVYDPYRGQDVPDDGATVEWTPYWERRYRDGVIEILQPQRKKSAAKDGGKNHAN